MSKSEIEASVSNILRGREIIAAFLIINVNDITHLTGEELRNKPPVSLHPKSAHADGFSIYNTPSYWGRV